MIDFEAIERVEAELHHQKTLFDMQIAKTDMTPQQRVQAWKAFQEDLYPLVQLLRELKRGSVLAEAV